MVILNTVDRDWRDMLFDHRITHSARACVFPARAALLSLTVPCGLHAVGEDSSLRSTRP